jgi:hypothetical protein
MKKVFLFFGTMALFTACSTDENVNSAQDGGLSAVIENNDSSTRVALSGLSNKFETGDKIKVWSDASSSAADFTVAAGTGTQNLSGGTAPSRTQYYYGAGINSGNDMTSDYNTDAVGNVDFWFPRDNSEIFVTADNNQLSATNFPLAGRTDAKGNTIKLKSVACLFKLKVVNNSSTDINSVKMEAVGYSNIYLKDRFRVNIENLNSSTTTACTSRVGGWGSSYLKGAVTIPAKSTRYLYFVVPDLYGNSTFKGFKPTITLYSDNAYTTTVKKVITKSAIVPMHGTIKNMGAITLAGKLAVSFAVDPTEGGSVSKSDEQVNANGTLSGNITATANNNYIFDGWYNGTKLITNSNVLTPALAGTITATTNFTAKFKCIVTYKAETGGSVSKATEYVAKNGKTSSSIASATSGYIFKGWYNASGTLLTTNTTLSGQTITTPTTFTAKFEKKCDKSTSAYSIKGKFTSKKAVSLYKVGGNGNGTNIFYTEIFFYPNGNNSYFYSHVYNTQYGNDKTNKPDTDLNASYKYDSTTGIYTITIQDNSKIANQCPSTGPLCTNIGFNSVMTIKCPIECGGISISSMDICK